MLLSKYLEKKEKARTKLLREPQIYHTTYSWVKQKCLK